MGGSTALALLGSAALAGSSFAAEGAAAPVTVPVIRIDASRSPGPVRPLLQGHFLEFMYEGIKGGLWAELLRNRGFEETSPASSLGHRWERYPDDRNDDPGFAMGGARAGVRDEGFPPGSQGRSQVLVCGPSLGVPRGIYQRDLPVRGGISHRGSLWIRAVGLGEDGKPAPGESFKGCVTVSLEEDSTGGKVHASSRIHPIGAEWGRHAFELSAASTDLHARFVIQVEGRGILWIDQASLLPGDSVNGVRSDVFEKAKALRPAFLRWPGGNVAQDYHFAWGVGPRDERPVWSNLSWNDEPEPSDFGTPEYIELCRSLGAEPTIVINLDGRGATLWEAAALRSRGKDPGRESPKATPEEAARWVEYCNGPASSPGGRLRGRDGHEEPFGVRYWELGNEIWGDWVRGHTDAVTYARSARRYIEAMRSVDPRIRFIAVGHHEDMEWNAAVLQELGPDIDSLSIHHYYGSRDIGGDIANLFARPLHYERLYSRIADLIRDLAPGRKIELAINEWNTLLPLPAQHSMTSALYAARLLHVFERRSDIVAMTAVSDLVNGWSGGIIQSSRHRVFTTPTYLVLRAYSTSRGAFRLGCEVEGGPHLSPSAPEHGGKAPALDAVASSSADGSAVHIRVVNTSPDPVRARIELRGIEGKVVRGTLATIRGPSLDAANTFDSPDTVGERSREIEGAGAAFPVDLEPASVNVITLGIAR